MKFYCINKKDSLGGARAYLKNACESLGIEFVEIVSEKFDAIDAPMLGAGDMLYRVSTDKISVAIEQHLINEKVATFHNSMYRSNRVSRSSYVVLKDTEIPMPKTISIPSLNKKVIEKYVEYLGGFPIIVKVVGGMRGVGVIKIDSMQALYSITDYLDTIGSKYIFREFIDVNNSERLVVLGDQVIAGIQYKASGHDFRSNSRLSGTGVIEKKYSQEIEQAAIKATKLRGLDFGGVDVLIDKNGRHYILEVNFPFGFPEVQKITGVDIAKEMLTHLQEKANKFLQEN